MCALLDTIPPARQRRVSWKSGIKGGGGGTPDEGQAHPPRSAGGRDQPACGRTTGGIHRQGTRPPPKRVGDTGHIVRKGGRGSVPERTAHPAFSLFGEEGPRKSALTMEMMGINPDDYIDDGGGLDTKTFKRVIEAFWALPDEDGGNLRRPLGFFVWVKIVIQKKGWVLRCFVDGGAARNVIRSDIYEEMERGGLSDDPSIVVPRLRDISGNPVKAGGGARLKISVLPRREKEEVVVFKADVARTHQMVLGAPFLRRHVAQPSYRWMVLHMGA